MKLKSENGMAMLGAGMILIMVLAMSVGMYVYNSVNSTIRSAENSIYWEQK